jgi:hypothetical protein
MIPSRETNTLLAVKRSGNVSWLFGKRPQDVPQAIQKRTWFSYKSSYNRESSGRSVNYNTMKSLVEPIGIEPTTS